ncbi:Plasmodium exported protein (PHISTa-like), unknown function [Plasmodium sp. gorilla clade G2]|uniref:Plasmodium exported protein (PHISTa-like), unknown function n=1 Tax=Plasmodium sp. gorilla clade G2 TaxID=880535 RepID=UPI000D266B6F|nr:Plasmodium exported protein (PHISTa-like), unknown function [Plasmodium sp. gorilla clade G2]SOV20000.1 Plasmodium exported protein (PHISTa-like), unknown function [Plasmodium sp. gorilla clade G2]
MAIIYNKKFNTHKYNLYSTNVNRQRMKCRISCRSFIFISLSLCVISLFYLSSWNVHEENIVPSTKYVEIMTRNLSEIENENNNDMKRKNKMNPLDITIQSPSNTYNNETVTLENKPYNDISKSLSEKELYDVLNSLKECPSNEDLRNIWAHTLGVAKEGLDDTLKVLKSLIQKYLDNDVYDERKDWLYDTIWKQNLFSLCEKIATEELEYSIKFFSLINDKHTLDDILKFIYSFLEYFKIFKKELHEKYQRELLEKIAQALHLMKINYFKIFK